MKHFPYLRLSGLLLTTIFISSFAQNSYTPYDEIPGIIKDYKPAYEESFPDWAKMLYQYPVNFYELNEDYEKYIEANPVKKSPVIRYYKIWRRAVESYVQQDGSIILPDDKNYFEFLFKTQSQAGNNNNRLNGSWSFLGPRETFWLNESGSTTPPSSCPWQVNVYSFDVATADNNILYCGTETGYVNKTSDGGMNWYLLSPEYPFGGGITAVAIHPDDAGTVYVSAGNNIHKTTDGGNSWNPLLQPGNQFYANRLKIDDDNNQNILASSADGVFLSFDAGDSWIEKWSSPSWDVDIKPDNHDIIYALTKSGNDFALAISIDGGMNFNLEPSFPDNIFESSGGLLAVTPSNPDLLFVILLSSDNTPYLYKGNYNNGNWVWELIATGQTTAFGMDNGQGYFDLVLDISPNDPNIIMVGTTTLFKSLNGGYNFTAVGGYYGNFSIHPDIQDIKMLPTGDTWVSTDGGMNLTTDHFVQQSNYHVRINGLIGSDMWGFDQGWNEDLVVGGRYHNGNTVVADFYQPKALRMGGAESPTGWILDGRSRHAAFNDLGNGWILPQDAESAPEGRFIFSKYPNMDEYGGRRGNLVAHPNYYGTLFLGEEEGFWRTNDMGTSWDLLYTFPGRVRYLDISYSNPDVIYADIVNQGLFKSEDAGNTWTLKPSLCSSPYGSSYWKGKLFFAISPFDENTVYACLQNGTWSADIGQVFKTEDGGDTWEDWTGSLNEYTKCICIQPSDDQGEIAYLFTTSRGGSVAKVFYRSEQMNDWESFSGDYPAGMSVNIAMPFFRDGKIRVGGNAGIWESSLLQTEFEPIANPWLPVSFSNCMLDTLYFEDHSIMNHEGASWTWEITPEPVYIEDINMRNPKVVLGNPGTYSVTLSIEKNGQIYSKTLPQAITTTTCPSIDDCSNPAELPKDIWELLYVDSEEVNYPGLAIMSFDNDPGTIWHTRWSTGSDPYPHEIQIDMGETYRIYEFIYLTRQQGVNGRIKDYELFISEDPENWGEPVSEGSFINTSSPQNITFPEGVIGRYFRVLALSEINGNAWASAAEFTMVGCTDLTYDLPEAKTFEEITAFPVPANGAVNISVPDHGPFRYQLFNIYGQLFDEGIIALNQSKLKINIQSIPAGTYIVLLQSENGTTYRVKIVKN